MFHISSESISSAAPEGYSFRPDNKSIYNRDLAAIWTKHKLRETYCTDLEGLLNLIEKIKNKIRKIDPALLNESRFAPNDFFLFKVIKVISCLIKACLYS